MTPQQQLDIDVKEWMSLKAWLDKGKEREMELRKSIADRVLGDTKLPNGAFPEGTRKGTGVGEEQQYRVILTTQWKRDVLDEMIAPTWAEAQLTADEAKDLLKYKPEISVRAYRKLPEAKQLIVDKMLNCKQGSITLEIIPIPK